MTIAPADPASVAASAAAESEAAAQDGPGTALLRTLTDLTADLPDTDPGRVAAAALRGRSARADEAELRSLATEAAAGLISEDPAYSRLAARLLTLTIADEAAGQGAVSFSASVAVGHREGLIADRTAEFVARHAAALDALVERSLADGADDRFGYFGLRTLHSRYLLRHPHTRQVIETPQHFMLRVASGLAEDDSQRAVDEVAALYGLMSRLDYLPSSPTLFNSGTRHPQMSSCYLLDSPLDELDSIYDRYHQVARLSKHAGGIGLSYSRIRSRGSLIRGTNGHSNGIVPFLKTLDASVAAVNQGAAARAPPPSTWRPGTRTSRSSWSCATTRARTSGVRTTSTWRTGSRTSSCAGSTRTATGRCSRPPTYPASSTCGATSSTPRTGPPRPGGWPASRSRPASCTAG